MATINSVTAAHQVFSTQCLRDKIATLVSSGCNFSPNTELYDIFNKLSTPTMDLHTGLVDPVEASLVFPENMPSLVNYIDRSTKHPKFPIFGDLGSGVQFINGYVKVSMSFINVCSDDGVKSGFAAFKGQIVIKSEGINYDKENLRRAGWQLICQAKLAEYAKLLN
jgi:hypothetical protein